MEIRQETKLKTKLKAERKIKPKTKLKFRKESKMSDCNFENFKQKQNNNERINIDLSKEDIQRLFEEINKINSRLDNIEKIQANIESKQANIESSQINIINKLTNIQQSVNGIENDIYEDDYELEIICPYCNAEFVADVTSKSDIKCPECMNIIELDFTDEDDDE